MGADAIVGAWIRRLAIDTIDSRLRTLCLYRYRECEVWLDGCTLRVSLEFDTIELPPIEVR